MRVLDDGELDRLACQAAHRYARRCEFDELRQVAWVAMLSARGYDPARGSPKGYFARVAYFACRRHMLKTRSVVSGARDCTREHMEVVRVGGELHPDESITASQLIDRERVQDVVRRAVIRAVKSDRLMRAAVYSVVVHGVAPARVAKQYRIDQKKIYWATARVRDQLKTDQTMLELASEVLNH